MKKTILTLCLAVLTIGFVNAQTSDKEIKFGGRMMFDMAILKNTFDDKAIARTEFRRVRLYSSGIISQNVKYKLNLDFVGEKIAYKDVWMELGELPFSGEVRVGRFKEPFRLEVLTSSKHIAFMERSLSSVFFPERNTGIMYNTNMKNKISLQMGVFSNGNNFGNELQNYDVNVNGRITYSVINNENRLLHLGLAGSKRKNSDKTYGFSTRAENHLGNKLISVSFEDVAETNVLGGEVAYVTNSLSMQAEYLQATVVGIVETELSSYYGQISYFLTGESRPYKSSLDGFGRIKPNNNYGGGGKGAFELVARISNMDLAAANKGTLDDITLGVNWYLNPYTRVMLNYVMAEKTDLAGEITTENAAMMRMQIDF
jgi:phosphate-selective porin OprO/OprP